MNAPQAEVLLPERLVGVRYSVTTRTLRRWDLTPGLGFPAPIYIKKRRYRSTAALDTWDRENGKRAAGLLATTRPTAAGPA